MNHRGQDPSRRGTHIGVLVVLLGCLATAGAQQEENKPRTTVIQNVAVVDVEKGALIPGRTVVVVGDRIGSIDLAEEAEVPDGSKIIDGAGQFLMPGLFDAHTHFYDTQTLGPLLIASGVVFVREMGNDTGWIVGVRDTVESGDLLAPEMIVVGSMLEGETEKGQHFTICRTRDEGREAVRRHAEAGVDQIKVYSSLSPEVYEAIVAEAKERGLKVVGHVPERVGLLGAARAGQASAEHMDGWIDEVIRLARRQGIEILDVPPEDRVFGETKPDIKPARWSLLPRIKPEALGEVIEEVRTAGIVMVPTLVALRGVSRLEELAVQTDPRIEYMPHYFRDYWSRVGEVTVLRKALPHMRDLLRRLHEVGVPIACGTDYGGPHVYPGFSLHEEMALLQDIGLSPADVLRSATVVPARLCGVVERLGTVDVGKTASLLLLRKNPLEDARHVSEIEGLFFRGEHFDRKRLDGLLESAKEAARRTAPRRILKDELTLPGEILSKGRYKSYLGPMLSQVEDFLITKFEGGYRLISRTQALYGDSPPHMTKAEFGPEGEVRSVELIGSGDEPLRATFTSDGKTLRVELERDGETLRKKGSGIEGNAVLRDPYNSALLYFQLARIPLDVDKGRSLHSYYLRSSGEVSAQGSLLRRKPDTTIYKYKRDDEKVTAKHFTLEDQSGSTVMRIDLWFDESGRLLIMEPELVDFTTRLEGFESVKRE